MTQAKADELRALADWCEGTDCASYNQDGEIAFYAHKRPRNWHGSQRPKYTTSVDDALTLVPPEHFWSLVMKGVNTGGFSACCQREGSMTWHNGATPALALCAAALRARAEIEEK